MDTNLTPIGVVRNSIKEPERRDWRTVVSEIIVSAHLTEALEGLEEFSHIIVLYWMHMIDSSQRSVKKVHPKGRQELPPIGVFASRSPARPNPVGIATVRLISRHLNVLKVIGLDAIDGTPVLDIKPYTLGDSPHGAKTPPWITRNTDLA